MGARVFSLSLLVALGLAVWLPSQGAAGAAVVLESVLVVIGVGAGLAAASSAGSLPEDRGSGVHAWLAATACPKSLLRAAPAVAGVVVTIVAALGATFVAATAMAVSGLDMPTRHTTPLRVTARMRKQLMSYDDGPRGTFEREESFLTTFLPDLSGPPGTTVPVEIDVRPRFVDLGATDIGSVRISFGSDEPSDGPSKGPSNALSIDYGVTISVRGRSDVLMPAVKGLFFHSDNSSANVSTVSARRIDGPASFPANLLRAGLLLGLALASIAPVAALLSRFLSAASAVTAALVLAGVGALHGPLLSIAADARGIEGASIASAILEGATWLAPDLSVVGRTSEALVGHVLSLDAFAGLASPAIHATVALALLAFFPARRVDA